ncbi:MAG: hypothetical protein ACYDBB_02160 [Armatimonadota bacterium]
MKIDNYISISRRAKNASSYHTNYYSHLYDLIKLQYPFPIQFPTLFVTYSTERLCELVSFNDCDYLVFDQNLSQAINQLNRIYNAKSNWPSLVSSFAFKILSDKMVSYNHFTLALSFAGAYRMIISNIPKDDDVFNNDVDALRERALLLSIQDSFILAHELIHFSHQHPQASKPNDIISAIDKEIDELINFEFTEDEFLATEVRYGKKYAKFLRDNKGKFTEYQEKEYAAYLQNKELIIPELLADRLASLHVFRLATQVFHASCNTIILAIFLSFKYMRLIKHIKFIADSIHKYIIGNNKYSKKELRKYFITNLDASINDIESVMYSQLRERHLRMYLYNIAEGIYGGDRNSIHSYISDHSDQYDDKIENNLITDLVDRLVEGSLASRGYRIQVPTDDVIDILERVDKLTNWSKNAENVISEFQKYTGLKM